MSLPPPNNFNYPYDPIHDTPPQPILSPQQQQQHQQQLQQQLQHHPIYSPQHSFQQSPPIYDPPILYAQDPAAFQPQHQQEHYAEPTHAEPTQHDYIPPTDETPSDEEEQPPPKQRGRRRKQQVDAEPHEEQAPMNPAPRAVNIKTKFPVARIKRIMQADEDVGKVAQVSIISTHSPVLPTPTPLRPAAPGGFVGSALEQFANTAHPGHARRRLQGA